MDARSLTPERSRELAALRRRAYGPNADIQRDPDALDRLDELERLARSDALTADDAGSAEELSAPVAAPSPPSPDGPGPVSAAEPGNARLVVAAPATVPHGWWRKGIVWGIAAASLLAGIGIGAWGYSLTLPRPDFTLHVEPSGGERSSDWNSVLSALGVDAGSAVPHEGFNGLDLWTAHSDSGTRCVLVTHQADPVSVSCAAADLDPTLDVTVLPGMSSFLDAPLPQGRSSDSWHGPVGSTCGCARPPGSRGSRPTSRRGARLPAYPEPEPTRHPPLFVLPGPTVRSRRRGRAGGTRRHPARSPIGGARGACRGR